MKKNNILNTVKILGLCLVFSLLVGISFVGAQVPPANNVAGPLNVGTSTQVKSGGLDVGNLNQGVSTTAMLRTAGGFRALGPALFDDTVVIGYGNTTPSVPDPNQQGKLDQENKKQIGFFSKLSNFLGLSDSFKAKKALAVNCLDDTDCSVGQICNHISNTCVSINAPAACGSANGSIFASIPSQSLCNVATTSISPVIATSTGWSWSCINTGNTAHCSANNFSNPNPTSTPLYYLTVNGNSKLNGSLAAGSITSNGINVCLSNGTNCQPAAPTPSTARDFGGTFTIVTGGALDFGGGGPNCIHGNPLDSSSLCKCSSGFVSYPMADYTKILSKVHQPLGYIRQSPVLTDPGLLGHAGGYVITDSVDLTIMGCRSDSYTGI